MPTVTTGIAKLLNFEMKSNKNVASGYCPLDVNVKVPLANLYTGAGGGLDADGLDGYHAAAFLLKTGGQMLGQINYTDLYFNLGYQTGIQAIGGGVPRDLTFFDSAYPAGKTLSQLVAGGGVDHGGLSGLGDDDHTQYLLVNGTRAMAGVLDMDSYDIKRAVYIKSVDTIPLTLCYGSTTPVIKLGIGAGLTAYAALAMNNYKITGLAAASANGDALRYEQLIGAYLPLVAGVGNKLTGDLYINSGVASGLILQRSGADSLVLTANSLGDAYLRTWDGTLNLGAASSLKDITIGYVGQNILLQKNGTTKLTVGNDLTASCNLYIDKTTPMHYFQELAATKLAIGWQNGPGGAINNLSGNFTLVNNSADIYIDAAVAAKSIYMRTGAIPTTRLTVADAAITSTVPLAMGSQKITGLAAGTVAGDAVRYEQLTPKITSADTSYFRRLMQNEGTAVSGTWQWYTAVPGETNYASLRGEAQGWWTQNGPANGNEYKWSNLYLGPGLYYIYIVYMMYNDAGIAEFLFGPSIFGTIDMYKASPRSFNNISTIAMNFSAATTDDLRFKVGGKNASSSNYYINFSRFEIHKYG